MEYNRENKYHRAKSRVEALKKFYTSLITYLFFITFLACLNYWTTGFGYPWFLWAAFGWGIGIAFHAFKVFGFSPIFGRYWEERKIKELMDKDNSPIKWN